MDVQALIEIGLAAVLRAAVLTLPIFLLVLAVVGVGRRWIAPWARQALWSLVLLRLVLPISVASPLSLQPEALREFVGDLVGPTTVVETLSVDLADPLFVGDTSREPYGQSLPSPEPSAAPPEPVFDWTEFAVPGVLLLGMLAMASWTAITSIRLRRWVRSGTDCHRDDWTALLSDGRRRFGIQGDVTLRMLPGLTSPATYGWRRPLILLPEDAASWSSSEMRHVLWHELAHIRRRDAAANWGLAVVRVLHWWNPVFWWTQRSWLTERELACDAMVLRQLEGREVQQYGQTLLRFIERLASTARPLPTTAPGFVLFLGRKRAIRQRLRELARLSRPEAPGRRWIAGGLILTLALVGLTDAAPVKPQPRSAPLELPAGTTWRLVPVDDPDANAERTVRVYSLSAAIKRLQQDDPAISSEIFALDLQQTLQAILQPRAENVPELFAGRQSDKLSPESSCTIQGETLVVNATQAQHEELSSLLNRWSLHGRRQVSIGAQLMTTGRSLKELLPGTGGSVLNLRATQGDEELGNVNSWTQHCVPSFVQILSPSELQSLLSQLQGDSRSNILSTPKITTFDGLSASIQCGSIRPFVTGLRSLDAGGFEPQISLVEEGIRLHLRALVEGTTGRTQLAVKYQLSDIVDVEVLEMSVGGRSINVQAPHVSRTVVATIHSIPAGHALLVAPLHRDRSGQLHLALFSPLQLP
jgi:beta-lactamase regulating signal transducer with metallopeptidase domain